MGHRTVETRDEKVTIRLLGERLPLSSNVRDIEMWSKGVRFLLNVWDFEVGVINPIAQSFWGASERLLARGWAMGFLGREGEIITAVIIHGFVRRNA